GGGAPRMSCSTDDHRISRANRGGPNVEGKAVRRARSACSSIIGTEPWVSSTSATSRTRGGFTSASPPSRSLKAPDSGPPFDSPRARPPKGPHGKAARVVPFFSPLDVTRRPPLTLLAPDRL